MQRCSEPKVYGAVAVGEKGQIVIPAEVRKIYGIKSGDRMIVFSRPGGPIALIPADKFSHFLEEATAVLAKMKRREIK
jgi:AbrB family looped-hinge helix DNA binding protein